MQGFLGHAAATGLALSTEQPTPTHAESCGPCLDVPEELIVMGAEKEVAVMHC